MAKYLIFNVFNSRLGLPLDKIVKVKLFENIEVDQALPWPNIAVIQLRKKDVPIIDLYALLSGEKRKDNDYGNCKEILILSKNNVLCGFLIDDSIGLIDMNQADILPLPNHIPGIKSKYYLGLKKIGGNFNLILNQENILEDALKH